MQVPPDPATPQTPTIALNMGPMRIRRTIPNFWMLLLVVGMVIISAGLSVAADPLTVDSQDRSRVRARDLGIVIGQYPPGPLNAITDVEGVKVGHVTLVRGEGPLQPGKGPVRTGVTVIIPRDEVWHEKVPAGAFVLNGTGEMTGLAWVAEAGFLEYPIALTSTLNVPRVADGVISWMIKRYPEIGVSDDTLTPVVAECDDSRLNDSQGRHVSEMDTERALDEATTGPVAEGSVGAGTGMISYQFKGGIGTSSRRLPAEFSGYTVGVLVNANHGRQHEFMVAGCLWVAYGMNHLNNGRREDRLMTKGRSSSLWPRTRLWMHGNLRGWRDDLCWGSLALGLRHTMGVETLCLRFQQGTAFRIILRTPCLRWFTSLIHT